MTNPGQNRKPDKICPGIFFSIKIIKFIGEFEDLFIFWIKKAYTANIWQVSHQIITKKTNKKAAVKISQKKICEIKKNNKSLHSSFVTFFDIFIISETNVCSN